MKSLHRSVSSENLRSAGFTLIELLIGIGILAAVFGVGIFVSMDYYRNQTILAERDMVVTLLRRARAKALANVNQSDHGISFGTSTYALFQGSSYAARDPVYDEEYDRAGVIAVIGGFSEVVFRSPDGPSVTSGSIIMSNGVRTVTISINYEGRISRE